MHITTRPRMWIYHTNTPEGRIVWKDEGQKFLEEGWTQLPPAVVAIPAKAEDATKTVILEPPMVNVPRETPVYSFNAPTAVDIKRRGRPPKVA